MTALTPVPVIPKRKPLTKAQRARVFDQADGICHLCREPIKLGEKWQAEHPEFRAGGGSDRIEDLRPAHVDCHKPKTAQDVATLAKTNRVRASHLGITGKPTQLSGRTRAEMNRDKEIRRAARGSKTPLAPKPLFI